MNRRKFLETAIAGVSISFALPRRATAEPAALAGLSGPAREEIARLIDAARNEGKVVIYQADSLGENFGRHFRAYFGLPDSFSVEQPVYKTADLQGRLETELRAGKLTADAIRFPIGPWVYGLKAKGLLLEWPNPEEKAYATIHAEPGYWVPTMWVPVIVWNPQKVEETLETWRDLLNPKYAGRVAIGDASKSAGWMQHFYILSTRLSMKYFEDLSRMKPGFIVSAEALVEAAISGEYPIVTTTSFSAYRLITQRKAQLRVAYPKDGIVPVVVANFFALKNAPHPSAARLARLFHASKEGQEQVMREVGFLSFRPDIESPNEKLLPPITKLNLIPFDYRKIDQKELDQFRKRFITIFGL